MKSKTVKRKVKVTLEQVVKAAHEAGAKVSVSLEPKPISLQPMRMMAEDFEAILYLAATRNIEAIRVAQTLLRRISTNQCLKLLSDLEREYFAADVAKAPILDTGHTWPGAAYMPTP